MKFRAKTSTVRSLQHELTECLKANYIRKYLKYKSNNYVTREPIMLMMLLVFIRLQCKGYAECVHHQAAILGLPRNVEHKW